ncbi:hypothetical protein [Brassicibacter mesophilus]|uniref:hypothetical protein n=1 Tax=Brassicibacter mesophilus TaxID=745119 RepID=UPI003D1E5459
MKKISENIDLSKKVLDINIESPIFKCMLYDLNKEIQRCIDKVYDQEFEAGEISLKLTLEIPDGYKEFPKVNEHGEMVSELYKYRKPKFEHKVTTTLKKQYKQEGVYAEEREVKFEDGQYIAVPVKDPQINIYDLERLHAEE